MGVRHLLPNSMKRKIFICKNSILNSGSQAVKVFLAWVRWLYVPHSLHVKHFQVELNISMWCDFLPPSMNYKAHFLTLKHPLLISAFSNISLESHSSTLSIWYLFITVTELHLCVTRCMTSHICHKELHLCKIIPTI